MNWRASAPRKPDSARLQVRRRRACVICGRLRNNVIKEEANVKKAKKAKRKAKQQEAIRSYLEDINHHIAQLSTALRALADKLDNVRAYHFDK
jgi:Mg2+ and Co2+ transporter CorA